MSSKSVIKYLICSWIIMLNCGHGTCYRSFYGRVKNSDSANGNYKVIFQIDDFNILPDTLRLNGTGIFKTREIGMDPQSDCKNDCSDGTTLPDSVIIKVMDSVNDKIVIDTVFKCRNFNYNGDDIELPTITLP